MINTKRKLLVAQLDRKLAKLQILREIQVPRKGWINAIRTSIHMSLAQFGRRLGKTPVAVQEIEWRERDGTITINKLIEVGDALDLQFVYGFIPRDISIERMIEKRAEKIASQIVTRTSHSMALEDQENSAERLKEAIKDRTQLLKQEIPKHLWD